MKILKLLVLLIISLFLAPLPSLAETPGGTPYPTNETDAADLSWEGNFQEGEKKSIKIEVFDEAYIHEKFVEGSRQPTVTFLVFHDGPSGWGKSIQDVSKDKFTGPGGHVEKTNLPLSKEDNKWVGEIIIVPQESLKSIAIWKSPKEGGVHVGYNVQVFAPKTEGALELTEEQVEKGSALHREAWKNAINEAKTDRYYKFALYSSRSLAVRHPEVYLKGDAEFLKHVTTTSGFSKAYEETNFQSQKLIDGYSGPPFNLNQVDIASYSLKDPRKLYPENAPYFDFLDRRVGPLSSVLKTKSKEITQLEKAFLLYFIQKEKTFPHPYIVYCDNHNTYLASYNKLVSAKSGKEVGQVQGNPILIFNEHSVWYPLMDRDETESDNLLDRVVSKYAKTKKSPKLDDFEEEKVNKLKDVTDLKPNTDRELAEIASVRASPLSGDPFRPLLGKHLSDYPMEIWHGIGLNWTKRANYISPFSAYLATFIDQDNLRPSVEKLIDVWHTDYGLRWGHIWECSLVQYTIDEVNRINYVHCVLHASSLSSVLDLANVKNFLIMGASGKPSPTHTYTSIPELGFVISNGDIEDRGTMINRGKDPWDTIWYIASGEKWAFPYIDYYSGNWAPEDLAQSLEGLIDQYGDSFNGFKSNPSRSDFHFYRTYLESEAFIEALYQEQEQWEPFRHP